MCFTTYKFIKKCMVVPGAHRPRGGGAAGPIRPWAYDTRENFENMVQFGAF